MSGGTRKRWASKDQEVVTPVDLDAIQDHPPGPQELFEGWCAHEDQQFEKSMRDWR
jgi:hypothetical protein